MGPKTKGKFCVHFQTPGGKNQTNSQGGNKKVKDSLRTSIAMETKKVFDQHFAQTLEEQKNKIKSFQENFTFLNQNVVQLVENRKTVEDQMSKLARSFDRTQQDMASLRAATATQNDGPHL